MSASNIVPNVTSSHLSAFTPDHDVVLHGRMFKQLQPGHQEVVGKAAWLLIEL